MTEPSPKPRRRRWYQFRFSTFIILALIFGWAMSCRPYWTIRQEVTYRFVAFPVPKHAEDGSPPAGGLQYPVNTDKVVVNPNLVWPALVLSAFFGWKARGVLADRKVYKLALASHHAAATGNGAAVSQSAPANHSAGASS